MSASRPDSPAKSPSRAASGLLPPWILDARAEKKSIRSRLPSPNLADSTRKEYAARAKRLAAGVDLVGVCKKELAVWKAAAKWAMAERVRQAMNECDKVEKATYANDAERWQAFGLAMQKIRDAMAAFEAVKVQMAGLTPGRKGEPGNEVAKKEAAHKKRPLTEAETEQFFAALATSQRNGSNQFRAAFLAAYFCGARPEEFAGGVEVRWVVSAGTQQPGLLFTIRERVKQGEKKGQARGRLFITVEGVRSPVTKRLFAELVGLVKAAEGAPRLLVKIDATANQTPGRRLTTVAAKAARKAFPQAQDRPSFYSLRQTFSANIKAAARERHGADHDAAAEEVAEALGHQSTETQRHYGRMARGGGTFAPKSVLSDAAPVRNYGTGGPEGKAKAKARKARDKEKAAIAAGMAMPESRLTPRGV